MRSCRTSSLALVLLLGACSGARGPAPAELDPLIHQRPARAALPDPAERRAGKLAAYALADDPDAAESMLGALRQGEHTGLADNAEDLLNATRGLSGYPERTRRMLDRDDLDPALRLRLETYLEEQPLNSAARQLSDDRRYKAGAIFNRAVAPLSHLSAGIALDPIETVRATVASIRVLHSFPPVTPRERKALHEWEEFLARNPDAPEAAEVAQRVERYRSVRQRYLHTKALEAAERALEAGSPTAATAHLDRADRLIPEDPDSVRLRLKARALQHARELSLRKSYTATLVVPATLDGATYRDFGSLTRAVLSAPPARIASLAAEWSRDHDPGPLSDELMFLESVAASLSGDEDGFTEKLDLVARTPSSNMARHASALLASPDENPYAYYRAAVRTDASQRRGWILFGRRSWQPAWKALPTPLAVVLDLPGRLISFVVSPIRVLRYRGQRHRFGGGVLLTGERYVERFPGGAHAAEVHTRLEALYAQRARWIQALEHHERAGEADPKRVADYRNKIADHTLRAARSQARIDVQVSLLRSIIVDYEDTDSAEDARDELREVVTQASAQRIRVSRGFLLEFPELWGPGALSLRPDLLDGKRANGEIAEEGIVLLGRNFVEISLEGREPLVRPIPPERFAHFIALLEEASYRQLTTDAREEPHPDPQRDLFFERARLGLLDTPDLRPTARSQAEFLSTREKHGSVLARESVLPVELVLRGDLDRLGLTAFPRIRLPEPEPDAFLYE